MRPDGAGMPPRLALHSDAARRLPARYAALLRQTPLTLLRWREASTIFAGLLLVVYFQSANSAFLSGANVSNLVDYTATTSIIAAGEVMVLVCGELAMVESRRTARRHCLAWQSRSRRAER